ncbi:adenine phosphoribosyltransferase [Prolixibacteraceae bacterium Z1-6]|uniref:Adenine phosphoribosyltransferase n=1 Tax=Draconibacterium aestuarii TaxID=2998507 RepID=A0A9X3FF16_9BACT|nr:adenine phosphoribosyltransferase [Prolixibacteraceae bacterium Z1-6]
MDLKKEIREVPDYPKEGISFKDITTLFKNKEAMKYVTDVISDNFKEKGITKVVGLEARGFILGGAVANRLDAGFVPIRKKGKLPCDIVTETYDLEYGTDRIEMHVDALEKDDVVLIHDDLLATGGTAVAALKLAQKCGVKKVYFSFICDLEFISTPNKELLKNFETQILVKY